MQIKEKGGTVRKRINRKYIIEALTQPDNHEYGWNKRADSRAKANRK